MLALPNSRSRIVLALLGLVLFGASVLKGHELATGPVAEDGLLTSRWFLVGLVELELALGLWLIVGLYPARSWLVVLAAHLGLGTIVPFQCG